MRLSSMKKVLAAALSTTMVVGMSMTALASGEITTPTTPTNPITGGGSIEAPIYSYEITRVVVPTSYGVAFNPDGLTVTVVSSTLPATATTTTAPVASKNYGILNKSSKDKLVKVGLAVTSTEPRISFVNSQSEIDNAAKGEYKIFLKAVPADPTEVKIQTPTMPSAVSAATSTQPSELAHVNMTKTTSATATVPLKAGNNELAFKLTKATYDLKSGQKLTLEDIDSTTSNNVKDKYEITGLAASGKGITGFTFDGDINTDADWTKISAHVQITPTYTVENADSSQTVVSGTGAMVIANAAPNITNTSQTLVAGTDTSIPLNLGTGSLAATGIQSVVCNGETFVNGTHYTYTAGATTLTIPATMVDYWLGIGVTSTQIIVTFNDTARTPVTVNLATP